MKTYNFKEYQILKLINENIDNFIEQVEEPQALEIQDVYNQQQEILKSYDLSDTELNNITKGLEDTIRVKLGIDESSWKIS